MSLIKEFFFWSLEKIIRNLIRIGMRPIVIIDSDLEQLGWIRIPQRDILFEGIKKNTLFQFLRVPVKTGVKKSENEDLIFTDDNAILYKGVNVFEAAKYSLCVSLDILMHEFDRLNNAHMAELHRWVRIAKSATDLMIKYFETVRPTAVVIIQGYFVEAVIARQLSDRYGYQVFAIENTFRSDRLICEPVSGISVNRNTNMGFFNHFANEMQIKNGWNLFDWVNSVNEIKHSDHKTPSKTFVWPDGLKKILFIGQCLTDSSVMFSGKPYATVEIFRHLKEYAEKNSCFLFLKLHPKEKDGTNPLGIPYKQLSLRKLKESKLVVENDNNKAETLSYYVDGENLYSTNQLIKEADVIVTINSQAGLESLVFGKEVILLGQAFYDQIECTWNLPDISLLSPCVDKILFEGITLNKNSRVSHFIHVYFEKYCIPKNAKAFVHTLITRSLSRRFFNN